MVLCHCVIVLVCINFFAFYDIIKERIDSGELYFIFKFVPSIFLAASVMIMDKVYGMIAIWLNDKGACIYDNSCLIITISVVSFITCSVNCWSRLLFLLLLLCRLGIVSCLNF